MSARVLRTDVVTLMRLDAAQSSAEGFRTYDALFARTGIQLYGDGKGGIRREQRDASEVFHADSLASYALRPITLLHPPTNVTTKTARTLARGTTGQDARRHTDGRHVAGSLSIWDSELLDWIDDRLDRGLSVDLSAGYSLGIDPTPGVNADGDEFDARHVDIRINHVAALPAGRAGSAKILTDGDDSVADLAPYFSARTRPAKRVIVDLGQWARHDGADLYTQLDQTQDRTMKFTIKHNDADLVVEVPEKATPQQIADATAAAIAKATPKVEPPKVEPAKVAADAAPPKVDVITREHLDAELAKVRLQSEDKADALSIARAVIGLDFHSDGTPDDIRVAVIESVLGKDEAEVCRKAPEAMRPGVIFGAFARARTQAAKRKDHGATLLDEVRAARSNATATDEKDPIAEAIKQQRDEAAKPRSERKKAG